MDMYYFEDEVAKAADEMKMRGFVGETIVDFPSCDSQEAYGGLDYCRWFICLLYTSKDYLECECYSDYVRNDYVYSTLAFSSADS